MKKSIVFLVISCVFFSFTADVQKRTIRDNDFDIECYITLKKLKSFSKDKTYYWFKSGEIHYSTSNAGGYVLHNSYTKYYRSNQLAEKGEFKYGLKTGVWESWHENGEIKFREVWKKGHKEGKFTAYDEKGNLILKGKYKNNLKAGYWIDYKAKDTVYYKKDIKFEEKPENLLQRIWKDSLERAQRKAERFRKRKTDSLKTIKIKRERLQKRKADSLERVKIKFERKIEKRNDSIMKAREKMIELNQKRSDSIKKARTAR